MQEEIIMQPGFGMPIAEEIFIQQPIFGMPVAEEIIIQQPGFGISGYQMPVYPQPIFPQQRYPQQVFNGGFNGGYQQPAYGQHVQFGSSVVNRSLQMRPPVLEEVIIGSSPCICAIL